MKERSDLVQLQRQIKVQKAIFEAVLITLDSILNVIPVGTPTCDCRHCLQWRSSVGALMGAMSRDPQCLLEQPTARKKAKK